MSLFPTEAQNAPRGLGAAMAGGKGPLSQVPRRVHDFYPTPPEATRALIEVERAHLAGDDAPLWEPCGRGGAIARELQAAGFPTVATDLVADPAHDVEGADLLTIDTPRARRVITNPPFALAAPMIVHLLDRLRVDYLALLLKSTFFHAAERLPLFQRFPPARIHALTWRLDFTAGGAPTMECAWFVWQAPHDAATRYSLLPKPRQSAAIGDLFG